MYSTLNVAGIGDNDILDNKRTYSLYITKWDDVFRIAVESALNKSLLKAGGYDVAADSEFKMTKVEQARKWFISNYPLLAGLAAPLQPAIDLLERDKGSQQSQLDTIIYNHRYLHHSCFMLN